MVDAAKELRGGRIDILVNVAGIPGPIEKSVHETDLAGFDEVMRVNVTGTFLPIKHAAPSMIAQRSGKIVNIGSNSGTAGYVRRVGYCASKWAVRGITRTAALELGPFNINVNCVNPGIVDGPRMDLLCQRKAAARGTTPDAIRKEYESAQALPRITTAEDVAETVLFLVGDAGRNITGQDIDIDGGWQI
jgi:3-oxoacyl-[acyl-carrier protein] reductase